VRQDVESFVKQCQVCKQEKHELCKYPGLLQPLLVPAQSWIDISMYFVEGLPNSNGYTIILVIVDRFTKYGHFYPIKHPFAATTIAQVFLDNVVKLHGFLSLLSVTGIKCLLVHFGLNYSSSSGLI
jgi:hypothetical protein